MESCCDRASGVSRGRHQYGHGSRCPGLQPLQALGEKARAEVLERRGRSVIQLQCKQRILAADDARRRRRQIQRRIRNVPERRLQPVAAEEPAQCRACNPGQGARGRGCRRIDRR